jgi:hypothetical protein
MQSTKTEVDAKSRENFLVPKLWHGMTFPIWWRLLRSHNFDVSPSRLPLALMVTLFSLNNSWLGFLQTLIYGRRIAETEIKDGPLFVIGHYRSGTTLLQELLCSDPRHTYPTTYECFSPHHFLLTEKIFSWFLNSTLPSQRLADRMLQGTDRPQEDEAAMCCLGMPSRFQRFAFPNREHGDSANPNLDLQPSETNSRWKETFESFLKAVTLRRPRRIVLKSPQHTCRVKHLADLFPNARFVYIVRDPYVVFPSTVRLWKVIHESQALQVPDHQGLEELVLREFMEMHELVERDRKTLDESRFCQVRYEELVADPIGSLGQIYEQLELGDFQPAQQHAEAYLSMMSDYQTNKYELSDLEREQIAGRWREFIEQHGYSNKQQTVSTV